MMALRLLCCICAAAAALADGRVKAKIVPRTATPAPTIAGTVTRPPTAARQPNAWPASLGGVRGLVDRCFTSEVLQRYSYTICPLANVTQREVPSSWNSWWGVLGVLHGVVQPPPAGAGAPFRVLYSDGTDCGAKKRTAEVTFVCSGRADAYALKAVSEPSTCEYRMTFASPEACALTAEDWQAYAAEQQAATAATVAVAAQAAVAAADSAAVAAPQAAWELTLRSSDVAHFSGPALAHPTPRAPRPQGPLSVGDTASLAGSLVPPGATDAELLASATAQLRATQEALQALNATLAAVNASLARLQARRGGEEESACPSPAAAQAEPVEDEQAEPVAAGLDTLVVEIDESSAHAGSSAPDADEPDGTSGSASAAPMGDAAAQPIAALPAVDVMATTTEQGPPAHSAGARDAPAAQPAAAAAAGAGSGAVPAAAAKPAVDGSLLAAEGAPAGVIADA